MFATISYWIHETMACNTKLIASRELSLVSNHINDEENFEGMSNIHLKHFINSSKKIKTI
jgi:hypothetical protein